MGYQDVTLYKLHFEDRPGLEVTAEGLATGALLDMVDLYQQLGDDPKQAAKKAALDSSVRVVVEKLMEVFAGALVSWNIEDRDEKPVPMTVGGLKSLNLGLVMAMITAWITEQSGVDDDLGKDSSSGENSDLERQLPMAARSPNPGS